MYEGAGRSKMGKKIVVFVIILTVILVGWNFYPKHYTKTLDGVFYKLENEEFLENVKIHIDGKLRNHLFGKKEFKGTVQMEGNSLPVVKGKEK